MATPLRARGFLEDGRRGRSAASAGGRQSSGGENSTHASRRITGGYHNGGGRALDGGGQSGSRLEMTATPNHYDGWNQRVRGASDEPTAEKNERRSNRRCN
jgi:hypothetical protein